MLCIYLVTKNTKLDFFLKTILKGQQVKSIYSKGYFPSSTVSENVLKMYVRKS